MPTVGTIGGESPKRVGTRFKLIVEVGMACSASRESDPSLPTGRVGAWVLIATDCGIREAIVFGWIVAVGSNEFGVGEFGWA